MLRGWGLTVLCRLLDASLVLRGIWTQPHQVKPGKAEALELRKTPASTLQLPLPRPHTHQEGITIFMLSVTGIRGLRKTREGPSCLGGMRKPSQ